MSGGDDDPAAGRAAHHRVASSMSRAQPLAHAVDDEHVGHVEALEILAHRRAPQLAPAARRAPQTTRQQQEKPGRVHYLPKKANFGCCRWREENVGVGI